MRVPLRRTQMGRAANSAALPLGSDWSSCSCRSCRAAASLTWVVRGCAPLRARVCAPLRRARWAAAAPWISRNETKRGGLLCFGIRNYGNEFGQM